MSGAGISVVAMAAVYATIGLHGLLLWGGRREVLYYALFGFVCLSMAAYSLVGIAMTESLPLPDVNRAQSLQLLFGAGAASAYFHFAHRLSGRGGQRAVYLVHLVPTFALCAHLGDQLMAATDPLSPLRWSVGVTVNAVSGGPTIWAHVLQAVLLVLVLGAGYLHYASPPPADTFRPAAFAPVLMVAAATFDLYIQLARIGLPYLTEYAFLLLALSMSARFIQHSASVSEELQRHGEALERGARRLEETKQELVRREQMAALGELSAIVAHELRNPLSILRNTVSGLGRPGLSDEDYQMLVGVMDEETDRLERLISDLITYVKPLELDRAEVALEPLLHGVLDRVLQELGPGEVRFNVRVSPGAERAYVDGEQLRKALRNLVDNAVHAGATTVEVRAEAIEEGGSTVITLTVLDTGRGMAHSVIERAPEPFFTTRDTGTGLGLAIVQRVARAHGGYLDIDSEPGEGTVVFLHLPRGPSDRVHFPGDHAGEATLVGFDIG